MTRQEVLSRLCRLQEEVYIATGGYDYAADCFCKEGGFWRSKHYTPSDYRNDGRVLRYIEKAVRKQIKRDNKKAAATS